MSLRNLTIGLSASFLSFASATAVAAGPTDPLYLSHDVIEIRIEAPLTTLMRERPDEEELDGKLSYVDNAGETTTLDLKLRTRGNYRRQERICPFAPIRLNVKRRQVEDTLLDEQDKFKLVTHCRNSGRYEQAALREYLVYRMFNELTDLSYRVRLLHITWVDIERNGRETVRYGFVIEDRERFAVRTGLEISDLERTGVASLDPAYNNLVSVFEYFAGNTDYSPIAGARGEPCCHNTHLYANADTGFVAVPYDFDMSGLVDAPYATPNVRFQLRSVRERLYRGRCLYNDQIPATLEKFGAKKATFYDYVNSDPRLNGSSRMGMRSFLDSFFKTIENPKAVESKLVDACIGSR